MDTQEKITEFIRLNGPGLPMQVAKQINSDTLMASAHLSELVSSKKLKISHVKVGSSPLYYLPGQEANLQKFSDRLHEKEKKAYELLKNNRVLREISLEPIARVALKNIKDFAVPLEVSYQGKSEIFWKWYLTPNKEAEQLIKEILKETEPKKADKEKPEEAAAGIEGKFKERQKKIEEQKPEQIQKEPLKQPIKEAEKTKEQPLQEKLAKSLKTKPAPKTTRQFMDLIADYFTQNKIRIIEKSIARKNSDAEFVIKVPSTVGELAYYCKAKAKKRVNEGDLSAAFINGQSKKLPVLILIKGELTKKAKEMLEKEFKGMSVKRI